MVRGVKGQQQQRDREPGGRWTVEGEGSGRGTGARGIRYWNVLDNVISPSLLLQDRWRAQHSTAGVLTGTAFSLASTMATSPSGRRRVVSFFAAPAFLLFSQSVKLSQSPDQLTH